MYNDRLLICKLDVILPIPDSMMPIDCCKNNDNVINFTTDDIISRFEAFSKNKVDALYLTKIMRI